ncbi:MAG: hypothetical protein MZU97_13105 [Bacillus subtilis]|nr:hypothetical protein [Bacillus subtilis]
MIFILSFMNTDGVSFAGATWTTAAWEKMFSFADPTNLKILGDTFLYALIATVICFLIGYPMAYIVARSPFSNKFVILILTIIPMWSNSLLRNVALKNILSETNILDNLLSRIGLRSRSPSRARTRRRSSRSSSASSSPISPFMILPIYTVIEKIDESLLEASMDLGANRVRTFCEGDLPALDEGRHDRHHHGLPALLLRLRDPETAVERHRLRARVADRSQLHPRHQLRFDAVDRHPRPDLRIDDGRRQGRQGRSDAGLTCGVRKREPGRITLFFRRPDVEKVLRSIANVLKYAFFAFFMLLMYSADHRDRDPVVQQEHRPHLPVQRLHLRTLEERPHLRSRLRA